MALVNISHLKHHFIRWEILDLGVNGTPHCGLHRSCFFVNYGISVGFGMLCSNYLCCFSVCMESINSKQPLSKRGRWGALYFVNRLFCSTPFTEHTMGALNWWIAGIWVQGWRLHWDIDGAMIMGLLYDNELQSGEDRGTPPYLKNFFWRTALEYSSNLNIIH